MARKQKKSKKIVKGTGRAVLLSILVHVGLFVLAGTLVVFTVVRKPEQKFDPPKEAVRPKMKLKKPKVKVKKTSMPKSASRIVTKSKKSAMPVLSMPEMGGMGSGLGDGVGGLDLMPVGMEEVTIFGGGQSIGNDMIVTFYSMARRADGQPLHSMGHSEYFAVLRNFVKDGWDKTRLAKYYRSPKQLYATTIMIPAVASAVGPDAFGESMDYGYCWVAHYEGKLVYKEPITFRFWGAADDVLTVAVDHEVVLAANFEWTGVDAYTIGGGWTSSAGGNRQYKLANNKMVGGDWITLEAGVPLHFEAIAGEGPGGEFNAQLLVEVKGEKYPQNVYGAPIFPMFAMAEPSWELQDRILMDMIEGEANVTNVFPIFRDY